MFTARMLASGRTGYLQKNVRTCRASFFSINVQTRQIIFPRNTSVFRSDELSTARRVFAIHVTAFYHQRQLHYDNAEPVTIYRGLLGHQIRGVKLLSLITSVGGVVAQPYLIQQASAFGNLPLAIATLGFIGCFTYVTPFLLHWVTKKYVIEIIYTPQDGLYTAVIYNFFLRKKKVTFTPDDVEIPDVPGMFTSFRARGVPLFIDPRMFEDRSHYARIMGYDKPLDLKLGNLDDKNEKS